MRQKGVQVGRWMAERKAHKDVECCQDRMEVCGRTRLCNTLSLN